MGEVGTVMGETKITGDNGGFEKISVQGIGPAAHALMDDMKTLGNWDGYLRYDK